LGLRKSPLIEVSLYSIPITGINFKNGDYITFTVTYPIKESFPAIIEDIEDVEVVHPRMTK